MEGLIKDLMIAESSYELNKQISLSYKSIKDNTNAEIAKILYNLSYTEMIEAIQFRSLDRESWAN